MEHRENCIMLWIGDRLPELQKLSLKSMALTEHKIKLFLYDKIPDAYKIANQFPNIEIFDASEIIPKENIWYYNVSNFAKGSVAGFADQWRYTYLYENGGTWVDFDIIAIQNILKFTKNEIIINSEKLKTKKGPVLKLSNTLMSFPKEDPLIKQMLDKSFELGINSKHGEAGPKLITKLLKTNDFKDYNKYVLSEWFITPVAFYLAKSFVNDTIENFFNTHNVITEEIFGIHVWNSYFKQLKNNILIDNIQRGSIYDVLRKAVNESDTTEEYIERLSKIIPNYKYL